MLGYTKTSHQSDWSNMSLYPSPSFLSKYQLAKESPDSVAPVVIPVRALRYYLDRTSGLRQNKELVFVSFKKAFDRHIPCHCLLMDQTNCDPML